MKITRIDAQVKNKGRYSVFVDDKFAFGLSELSLLNSGLRIGQELNLEELDALKAGSDFDKLYDRTLDLIMRRPRSEWEISDYLKRKKVENETAAEIMSKLRDKGFINDLDFATRWVGNRRLLKSISRRKLELELRQKRVADSIVRQVLENDETDEYEVLLAEVTKKRRQSKYQDNDKLMQYLARQGYGYNDIKRALADDAG